MGCSSSNIEVKQSIENINNNGNSKNKEKWKIFFVLGTPGSGKNTQCDKIEEKYQILHFSCGDLLREAAKENNEDSVLINNYIKEGKIVPAKITCELQKKFMQKNTGEYNAYLCDGFPRNEENFKYFLEVFGNECKILGVLYLTVPFEISAKRIKNRGGNRIDDNLESLKKRFEVMKNETEPNLKIIEQYAPIYKIDANKSIDDCFNDIDQVINPILQPRTKKLVK